MTTATAETPERFSAILRARTAVDHRDAEGAGFMGALMAGSLPIEGYAAMLAQHAYVYECLEAHGRRLADDPVAGPFVDERLCRTPALHADLEDLVGAGWRTDLPALAATTAYVERIDAASTWSGGFVAHHYTRYLGDLSGGQHIGRVATRAYGLGPGRGGRFASFDQIDDAAAYREGYRERLDSASWDAPERDRVIDEIHEAYRRNAAVFAELDARCGPR